MKNTDNEGLEKVCHHFEDGSSLSPFEDTADCLANVVIMSKNGKMRSGTAYSNLGRTYNYEPLYSVLLLIDILTYNL